MKISFTSKENMLIQKHHIMLRIQVCFLLQSSFEAQKKYQRFCYNALIGFIWLDRKRYFLTLVLGVMLDGKYERQSNISENSLIYVSFLNVLYQLVI